MKNGNSIYPVGNIAQPTLMVPWIQEIKRGVLVCQEINTETF